MRSFLKTVALSTTALISLGSCVSLNVDDADSIKVAARSVANGLMKYYKNNQTSTPASDIGTIDKPIYWWEAGAMWGSMIDYWSYIGDTSYVEATTNALVANFGPYNDLMPPWRNKELGNDDQGFWALTLMSAVEQQFPDAAGKSTWLEVAKNAFDTQAARWDTAGCNGGLRWQIFDYNNGYTYMNSISNGAFFQLAARLARYTGNQTYVEWAEKTWDWTTSVNLIDANYNVYDGIGVGSDCGKVTPWQWSYNVAIYLHGAATLSNITNGEGKWKDRTEGLLRAADIFFTSPNGTKVMYETICEPYGTCNNDQLSFKAYLSRWLGKTSIMAPYTKDTVDSLLRPSAAAAAASCTGGDDGNSCGTKWTIESWDGTNGVGQQMSALEVIQALAVSQAPVPVTATSQQFEHTAGEVLEASSKFRRRRGRSTRRQSQKQR